MSRGITWIIIPEVVSGNREERIMVLSECHAVLAIKVVRLTVSPVKPCNRGVPVRPPPVTRVLLAVTTLTRHDWDWDNKAVTGTYICGSSQPELFSLSNLSQGQQLCLEPVVDTWSIMSCLSMVVIDMGYLGDPTQQPRPHGTHREHWHHPWSHSLLHWSRNICSLTCPPPGPSRQDNGRCLDQGQRQPTRQTAASLAYLLHKLKRNRNVDLICCSSLLYTTSIKDF